MPLACCLCRLDLSSLLYCICINTVSMCLVLVTLLAFEWVTVCPKEPTASCRNVTGVRR